MTYQRMAIGMILLLGFAPGCKTKEASANVRPEAKVEAPKPVEAPRPAQTAAAAADPQAVVEIKISSVGDLMKFDTAKLSVKQGARVHVMFHSNATLDVLPHNWVLVKDGTEAAVALAGLNKGLDSGYLDPTADVLAHTPLAKPGQTVETTFVAPAAGTYSYICTCPGHYMMMHGKLIVTS